MYAHRRPTSREKAQRSRLRRARQQDQRLYNQIHHNYLVKQLHISTITEIISKGVAFHHAGLTMNDRHVIEQIFLAGHLPILVSTSTLGMPNQNSKHRNLPITKTLLVATISALGVNLPAHLVIIKSTTTIVAGNNGLEYTPANLLQMIGRAGRPQFDTSATAVVMTKSNLKVFVC